MNAQDEKASDGNQSKVGKVIKHTGHITVRYMGKRVDSNGNVIRRSTIIRQPTGLARKMATLYEEDENVVQDQDEEIQETPHESHLATSANQKGN